MRSQLWDRLVLAAGVNLCDEAVRKLLVEECDASEKRCRLEHCASAR